MERIPKIGGINLERIGKNLERIGKNLERIEKNLEKIGIFFEKVCLPVLKKLWINPCASDWVSFWSGTMWPCCAPAHPPFSFTIP